MEVATSATARRNFGMTTFFAMVLLLVPTLDAQPTSPKTNAAGATRPAAGAAGGKWTVSTSKSAMDDSQTVVLQLRGENIIRGWLVQKRPTLLLRCKEGATDLYINFGMPANVETGDNRAVRYRIDDGEPVSQQWGVSTDGEALFSPYPQDLARALEGASRLRVEMTPFNASPTITTFDVRGLGAYVPRVSKACSWRERVQSAPATPALRLIGWTMGEIEARFGAPSLRDQETWYYDTDRDGTLILKFSLGTVKDVRPATFDLSKVRRPGGE